MSGETLADAPADPAEDDVDPDDLAARVSALEAENERLRREYARALHSRYRRTSIGLAAVGAVATLGGLAFPDARAVLFALGATGLFAAVLTVYLAPERFVAARIGEGIYRSHAAAGAALVTELGLADARVYVPIDGDGDGNGDGDGDGTLPGRASVRLFVPQHAAHAIPPASALDALFVVTDDPAERGLSLPPTGGPLFDTVRRALAGPLAATPASLAEQLADGLVEVLELAARAEADADPDGGRVTLAVAGPAFGPVEGFDHPVASLVGVGLARGLGRPVSVEVTPAPDDRFDVLVTGRPTDVETEREG